MRLFLSAILFLFTFYTQAGQLIYVADQGDSLDTVVKEKLSEDELSNKDYETIAFKIKRYNPNITHWSKLQEGTKLFISSPLAPNIANYHQAYMKKACQLNRKFYIDNPGQKPAACN